MASTELLTTKEVQIWLRLSRSKVYELITKKEIPYIKIGGKFLFDKQKIETWLQQKSN
jgi:excisionase family DNA binding protein